MSGAFCLILSTEIRIIFKQLEHVATLPTIRLGMRLYLLTLVHKSERDWGG